MTPENRKLWAEWRSLMKQHGLPLPKAKTTAARRKEHAENKRLGIEAAMNDFERQILEWSCAALRGEIAGVEATTKKQVSTKVYVRDSTLQICPLAFQN